MASIVRDPRRNGSWVVRYRDPSGKQRSKSFPRKIEAERWSAQTQVELQRGAFVDPARGRMLVGEYADLWLKGQSHLKPSTLERYTGVVKARIKPEWGGWKLSSVSSDDVAKWLARSTNEGVSAGTVRKHFLVLSLVMKAAVQDGRIGRNPCDNVKQPRATRTEPRFLTSEELQALLARVSGTDELVVLTLAFTGLRFGELAALRVRRFNATTRRLTVAESVSAVGGKLVWTTPKTHQSRTVPLPRFLASRLAARSAGKLPNELIFTSAKGNALRLNNWRRRVFDPAVEAAQLGEVHPHDLRHTAVSLAVASGANVKVVQRMLGHASAAMTLDVYAGLFGDDLDVVADRFDALHGRTFVAQEGAKP